MPNNTTLARYTSPSALCKTTKERQAFNHSLHCSTHKGETGDEREEKSFWVFLADSKQSNAALKQSSHPTKKLHTISAFIKKSPLQRSRRIVTQQSCVLTSLYNLLNIFVQGSHCKHLMHCSKRRKTKVLEQYTV